jgi:hypothetical protein
MNEQTPTNNVQSDDLSRRELRRQRREERRAGGGLTWVAGLILIVLGTAFLLQNLGTFNIPLNNWWALFILIPALGAFDAAYRAYRSAGNRLSIAARGSLLGGLILTLVTATFLFNLDWRYFGPVLIILAGLGILVNVALPGRE